MSEIFPPEGQTAPSEKSPVAPTIQLTDEVAALVGEGKKYATIEKALEALPHSQNFIEQLKKENEELRKKTEGAVSREEVYETVQELLKSQQTHAAGGLDEEGVKSLLDRALQEREARKIVLDNEQTFRKAFEEKYGEKAREVYKEEAEKLGMTSEAMDYLARTNPKAALKLFGIEGGAKVPPRPTTPGSVNSSALANQQLPPPKQKSIMFGGTTKDMIAEWQRHKIEE